MFRSVYRLDNGLQKNRQPFVSIGSFNYKVFGIFRKINSTRNLPEEGGYDFFY